MQLTIIAQRGKHRLMPSWSFRLSFVVKSTTHFWRCFRHQEYISIWIAQRKRVSNLCCNQMCPRRSVFLWCYAQRHGEMKFGKSAVCSNIFWRYTNTRKECYEPSTEKRSILQRSLYRNDWPALRQIRLKSPFDLYPASGFFHYW